jgi:hypothetical protein
VARYPNLEGLVTALLARDPRPAYQAQRDDQAGRVYGIRLYDLDVRWSVADGVVRVLDVVAWEG